MGRKYPDEVAERRRVKRVERRGWHADIEADELDGGYVAQCVEWPGAISQGDTEAEALDNLADAVDAIRP